MVVVDLVLHNGLLSRVRFLPLLRAWRANLKAYLLECEAVDGHGEQVVIVDLVLHNGLLCALLRRVLQRGHYHRLQQYISLSCRARGEQLSGQVPISQSAMLAWLLLLLPIPSQAVLSYLLS